jgi:Flp pilus assembly pilin Flp
MLACLRRLFAERFGERGATAPEYVVMISLVILVVLGAVVFLGREVTNLFSEFGSKIAPFFGGS